MVLQWKVPITSVWLPSILPLRWISSKTSCVPHLALSVPFLSSDVWDQLVEIWALSKVRLKFPKLPKVEKSLTKINKNHHNFWNNNVILMAFEILNLQNIWKMVYFMTQSTISNICWDIVYVWGREEGYTVKYTPPPEGVPEGEARGNSWRRSGIFDRISRVKS